MHRMDFSAWLPWKRRSEIDCIYQHGIYLLARFDLSVPASVSHLDENVLLIAETHDQDFGTRWSQFERSARTGSRGHVGGQHFRSEFGVAAGEDIADIPDWLYVAAVALPKAAEAQEVAALKKTLLSDYRDQHGRLPKCNRRI